MRFRAPKCPLSVPTVMGVFRLFATSAHKHQIQFWAPFLSSLSNFGPSRGLPHVLGSDNRSSYGDHKIFLTWSVNLNLKEMPLWAIGQDKNCGLWLKSMCTVNFGKIFYPIFIISCSHRTTLYIWKLLKFFLLPVNASAETSSSSQISGKYFSGTSKKKKEL